MRSLKDKQEGYLAALQLVGRAIQGVEATYVTQGMGRDIPLIFVFDKLKAAIAQRCGMENERFRKMCDPAAEPGEGPGVG